jgi:putative tryptophan/tyrosine transport system substrate-binding protein
MRRREFIALLGSGVAAAWPRVARAQGGGTRLVGVLMNTAAESQEGQGRLALFTKTLRGAGWEDGRNIQIETRWTAGDPERFRSHAAELAALHPAVILASTTPAVTGLKQATQTLPIVFVGVIDPVGSGVVRSMAHPGGNATGFVPFEYSLAAKWLQLLKEIAPNVTRAAVLRDPSLAAGIGQFAAIQTVGLAGMELNVLDMRDTHEIEQAVAAFAREPNGGLIVTASSFGANHPALLAALAAQFKLPAVYPFDYFVDAGGVISYGPDTADEFRRAADYVSRILKGEKAADLPVQAPTRYELIVNLRTAKELGLAIPQSVLSRADRVIE